VITSGVSRQIGVDDNHNRRPGASFSGEAVDCRAVFILSIAGFGSKKTLPFLDFIPFLPFIR
jgi:hypothetical protein